MDVLVGRMLGLYESEEKPGGGGMGVVYRGIHTGLQQPRAVKVLLPHLAADDNFVRLFLREARLTAKLHHPSRAGSSK